MDITKLEKKKRLYLLELDKKEKLYVTEDTIVRFMLTKGKSVSEEELADIRDFAQFSYGKNLALYHLSFARRSRQQVADYLAKHEIDPAVSQRVLDELEADKWIDDAKLIQDIVQQQVQTGDKGPFILQQKLAQKGLTKPDIQAGLEDVDFSEACQRAAQKLLRKYGQKYPLKALKNKLYQQLSQKGYTSGDISLAIESLDLEADQESEEELLYKELDKVYDRYTRKAKGYELRQKLTAYLARKGYDFDAISRALRDYLD